MLLREVHQVHALQVGFDFGEVHAHEYCTYGTPYQATYFCIA